MTIKTLKNLIQKNGATLDKNEKQVNFKNGYQVSKKDCYILDLTNTKDILNKINGLFKSLKPGEFLGLWVEDNKIYIDISIKINNLKNAINFGKVNNQLSIFDWATKNCIYL